MVEHGRRSGAVKHAVDLGVRVLGEAPGQELLGGVGVGYFHDVATVIVTDDAPPAVSGFLTKLDDRLTLISRHRVLCHSDKKSLLGR